MVQSETELGQLLSPRQVEAKTTLSRTTIWRAVRAGTFPAPKKISTNRIAWRAADLAQWEASCGEAA